MGVWGGEELLGVAMVDSLVVAEVGEGTTAEEEGSLVVGSDEGGMGIPSSTSRASYFSILSGLAFLLAILSFWRMFSSSSSSALVRAALDSPSES